jgi:hypothetical protein
MDDNRTQKKPNLDSIFAIFIIPNNNYYKVAKLAPLIVVA